MRNGFRDWHPWGGLGPSSDDLVLHLVPLADPGAVVEAQTSVPYAIVGGILALLVFLIICVLVGMVWCSVRQKGEWRRGLNSTWGVVWLWDLERGGHRI